MKNAQLILKPFFHLQEKKQTRKKLYNFFAVIFYCYKTYLKLTSKIILDLFSGAFIAVNIKSAL